MHGISVIVPAYNEERVIVQTIASLLAGDHPEPFEIIVVDDGSSDATYRVAREASWLQSDLRMARAEAVRRGAPVGLCASSNGTACTAGATWRQGWILFSNARGDGSFDAAAGDQILRVQRAWSGSDTATTTPNADRLAFNGEGFAAVLRGGNTTITIRAPSAPVSSTRCLILNMAGTVSMQGGAACP